MDRRDFLKWMATLPVLVAYGLYRPASLAHSALLNGRETVPDCLRYARLEPMGTQRLRVLYVSGSPYERGFQHGYLLRAQVKDNLSALYDYALKSLKEPTVLAKAYAQMAPFIHMDYQEEMRGLADGAQLPLNLVHSVHALPSITELGGVGRQRFKDSFKQSLEGLDLGTSCSNLAAGKSATLDHKTYAIRVLDWGMHRISKMHEYPLITVVVPDTGIPYANIGWAGFLGAVSGMNREGITLGEMGYGAPDNETLAGNPMPFLLRDVLAKASNLQDVRRILGDSPGDNSYVFLMSDGKAQQAELYVKDHDRFQILPPGKTLSSPTAPTKAFTDVVYSGHQNALIESALSKFHGHITPEQIMRVIIPEIAMPQNVQNVVYDPAALCFWVSNASTPNNRAADQPYTFVNFAECLSRYEQSLPLLGR